MSEISQYKLSTLSQYDLYELINIMHSKMNVMRLGSSYAKSLARAFFQELLKRHIPQEFRESIERRIMECFPSGKAQENLVELRKQTFQDVLDDTPLLSLPIVFTGSRKECELWAKENGYTFKLSAKMLYGGYYYKNDDRETIALLPM